MFLGVVLDTRKAMVFQPRETKNGTRTVRQAEIEIGRIDCQIRPNRGSQCARMGILRMGQDTIFDVVRLNFLSAAYLLSCSLGAARLLLVFTHRLFSVSGSICHSIMIAAPTGVQHELFRG